jgi:K+-transporting ATPase KdpF subunit
MSGSNLLGVVVSAVLCIYLISALLRGERF